MDDKLFHIIHKRKEKETFQQIQLYIEDIEYPIKIEEQKEDEETVVVIDMM